MMGNTIVLYSLRRVARSAPVWVLVMHLNKFNLRLHLVWISFTCLFIDKVLSSVAPKNLKCDVKGISVLFSFGRYTDGGQQ